MAKLKRAINFDLSEEMLIKYHPSHNTSTPYRQIRRFMETHGFEHRQYSGYTSKNAMGDTEITDLLFDLFNKYSWLNKCSQVVDITNIGKTYSFLDIKNSMLGEDDEEVDIVDSRFSKKNKYNPER